MLALVLEILFVVKRQQSCFRRSRAGMGGDVNRRRFGFWARSSTCRTTAERVWRDGGEGHHGRDAAGFCGLSKT